MPYVSKYANAKLAFRAVQLKDIKMLKKLLKDSERIYSVCLALYVYCGDNVSAVQFSAGQGDFWTETRLYTVLCSAVASLFSSKQPGTYI